MPNNTPTVKTEAMIALKANIITQLVVQFADLPDAIMAYGVAHDPEVLCAMAMAADRIIEEASK